MKKIMIITDFNTPPDSYQSVIAGARERVQDLEIDVLSAPRNFNYRVPSPMVEFKSGNIYRREYGSGGMALIKDVTDGKIR